MQLRAHNDHVKLKINNCTYIHKSEYLNKHSRTYCTSTRLLLNFLFFFQMRKILVKVPIVRMALFAR